MSHVSVTTDSSLQSLHEVSLSIRNDLRIVRANRHDEVDMNLFWTSTRQIDCHDWYNHKNVYPHLEQKVSQFIDLFPRVFSNLVSDGKAESISGFGSAWKVNLEKLSADEAGMIRVIQSTIGFMKGVINYVDPLDSRTYERRNRSAYYPLKVIFETGGFMTDCDYQSVVFDGAAIFALHLES